LSKESENGLDISFTPKFDAMNTASSTDVESSLLVTYEVNGNTITIAANTDGSYTIPPGVQDLKVSIKTIDDNFDENNETFSLLANIASINKSAETSSTIIDNDTAVKANNDSKTASETGDEHFVSEDEANDGLSASGNVITNDTGSNPSFITSVVFDGASVSIPSDGSNIAIAGTHGTLSINSTGAYTYSVNETETESMNIGDTAHDIFTYTLSDGINADDTASLDITIEGKNDAPTIGSVVVENSSGIVIDGTMDVNTDGVTDTLLASELLARDGGLFFSENNGNLKMDMGTGGTDMSIEYNGGRAGYDNIFGYYELVNGLATNFKVLYIEDGSTKTSGASLDVLENLEGEIGFFLIPDGQDKSSIMNALNDDKSISTIEGTTITFSDGTTANTAVYYTDNNLSTDGKDHAIAGVSADGKGLTIGFEDLPQNNSDQDYDDFVITINYLDSIGNNGQVFTEVNFSDTDNANLAGATVSLENAQNEDSLNIGNLPAGITAVITDNNDGTITVVFSGSASLEEYENAIESISFDTSSSNREPRNFEIEITDGSKTDTLSKSVNIGSISLNTSSENEDDVIVSLEATSSVIEGGNILYTASLDKVATSDIILTLDNNETILIEAGKKYGTVSVEAPSDDVYNDASSVSVSVIGTQGGNFKSIDYSSASSSTSILDDNDAVTLTLNDINVEQAATNTIPYGISHVIYTFTDGSTLKIDDYEGDSKNPADPQKFVDDIEVKTGLSVDYYTIKASTNHYDSEGNQVADINNQANSEYAYNYFDIDLNDIVDNTIDATVSASLDYTPETELIITLSNGATITFDTSYVANTLVSSTSFTVEAGQDYTLSVSSTNGGGNFENLVLSDTSSIGTSALPQTSDKTISTSSTSYSSGTFTLDNYNEGGAKDIEDDANTSLITAIKIETLPEHGTLYYINDEGTKVEITPSMLGTDAVIFPETTNLEFVADSGYTEKTTIGSLGESGSISDWGSVNTDGSITSSSNDYTIKISGGTLAVNDNNAFDPVIGEALSTVITQAALDFSNNANTEVGLGLDVVSSDEDSNDQLRRDESISLEFDALVTSANIGFDGLAGHFPEDSEEQGKASWIALKDGVVVDFGNLVQDEDYQVDFTITSSTGFDELIIYTESSSSDTDFVLKYVQADYLLDDSFTYSAIDSDGNSSNISTVTLDLAQGAEAVISLNDVSVNEDATSAVYSVSVDIAPSHSPLVITLDQEDANGHAIVLIIPIGETSVSKTVDIALDTHSDEDASITIDAVSGGSYLSIDSSSSASLTVTAVADVVSVSIEVGDAVYDVPLVETKTDATSTVIGDKGDSVIGGANPSDLFTKEFDFGEEFANQNVTITIDATVSGSWNYAYSPHYTDDTFTVDITGNTSSSQTYMYGAGGSSNANINEDNIYTYDVKLDDEGKVKIDLTVATTEPLEIVTLNSITAVATQTEDSITYEVDIEAALVDVDGSESLSVTITNVPSEAVLSEGSKNADGT